MGNREIRCRLLDVAEVADVISGQRLQLEGGAYAADADPHARGKLVERLLVFTAMRTGCAWPDPSEIRTTGRLLYMRLKSIKGKRSWLYNQIDEYADVQLALQVLDEKADHDPFSWGTPILTALLNDVDKAFTDASPYVKQIAKFIESLDDNDRNGDFHMAVVGKELKDAPKTDGWAFKWKSGGEEGTAKPVQEHLDVKTTTDNQLGNLRKELGLGPKAHNEVVDAKNWLDATRGQFDPDGKKWHAPEHLKELWGSSPYEQHGAFLVVTPEDHLFVTAKLRDEQQSGTWPAKRGKGVRINTFLDGIWCTGWAESVKWDAGSATISVPATTDAHLVEAWAYVGAGHFPDRSITIDVGGKQHRFTNLDHVCENVGSAVAQHRVAVL